MPARRVLVPLIVLVLAAALWWWPFGEDPVLDMPGDARACTENLRNIHAGLMLYRTRNGGPPVGSGSDFLRALLSAGVWADTPVNRSRIHCPGSGRPYAARDTSAYPLVRFPSGGAELEPLAACDGGDRLAHEGCMNVLYSDGSVQTLILAEEIERGRLAPDTTTIALGPDSPIPELQKLVTQRP
ncbi:MAG: hypothetical protein HOP15_04800 [Planctomycetes bacterium]|nr:hypothetical protein [Planctomycetota bacterium]